MFERLIGRYLGTPIAMKYIGSVVRHALTFVAGLLVSYGVVKDGGASFVSTNYDVLMGLVAYGLAQWFSLKEKAKK